MYKYACEEVNRPIPADPELRKVNPSILDIPYRRGYRTDSEMRSILSPDIANALQHLDCQIDDAILTVLEKTVHKRMPIVIYHSYSVDGIAAGAVAECATNWEYRLIITPTDVKPAVPVSVKGVSNRYKCFGRKPTSSLHSIIMRAANEMPLNMQRNADSQL